MPSDPLLSAAKQWNRRVAIGANAGLPAGAVQSVAKADLARVGAGGSAMSDQEALAAIQSAATGKTSQTKTPSTSITGIPGRMVADTGQMLTGLAIGAAHAVEHPARDVTGLVKAAGRTGQMIEHGHGAADAAWLQAHGYDPKAAEGWGPSAFAAAFRNTAQGPLTKFLPGAYTAANLTTAAGRQQILAHPGFEAGDLIAVASPVLKGVARLGALGDVAEVTDRAGKLAYSAEPGSVAESALKGKVLTTALRAVSDGLSKLTGGRIDPVSTLRDALAEYGLTRQASQAIGQLHDWAKNLSPTDKQSAWDLHVVDSPLYASLADPGELIDDPKLAAAADHKAAAAAYTETASQLRSAAASAASAYDTHVSHVEQLMQPTRKLSVDYPPERVYPAQPSWHEASGIVRDLKARVAALGPGLSVDVRAAPEGWYVQLPGGPEALIPKESAYQLTPPDPAAVAAATSRSAELQASSSAAAQALTEHLRRGAPKLADYLPTPTAGGAGETLSAAQETLQRVFLSGGPEGPDRALLRALPADQQALVRQAYVNQGKLLALGNWAQQGLVRTTADLETQALRLDPSLRDRFLNSWQHFDPLDQMGLNHLRSNTAALDAVPGLGTIDDLSYGYSMPKGVYQALFKDNGYIRGVLTSVGGDTGVEREARNPGPLGAAARKTTGAYKTAVFLRPTMVVNLAVRGLIQAAGDQGPALFKPSTVADSFRMALEGDATITAGWRTMTTDQAHNFLAGTTAGRVLSAIPDAMRRATNLVSGVQRAMVFLTEHDQMVAAGLDEATARMAGMQAIRDVFQTTDDMTPVEQAVIRQIMPFYAYEKQLFQYLGRFPSEHPFVTEILAKVGQAETALNSSGVPQQIQQMLWLGNPDASGNVKTVDVSGFNPFRSFADSFTLAGFASTVNPALRIVLDGLGVHDLYPAAQYDPATGGLTAKTPGVTLQGVTTGLIPQLGTLEAMLGFNNRLKALKTSDPSAYRAYLFQTLGVPIPQTVNLPQQTARAEESLYRVSQTAVSNYIRTGDTGYISGYNLLPYQSRWWTPDQLTAWRQTQAANISQAQSSTATPAQATSLKALLQPLPRTTAQLPPLPQPAG